MTVAAATVTSTTKRPASSLSRLIQVMRYAVR
jgi:hypothetical protein